MIPTHSNVASSNVSVLILAANSERKSAIILNTGIADLYLLFAYEGAASNVNYSIKLDSADSLVLRREDYKGNVFGVWSFVSGRAEVTEFV